MSGTSGCSRVVGNVYLISENAATLKLIRERVVPVVENFNTQSKSPEPLYGIYTQLLESPKEKLFVPKEQFGGIAVTIVAIPRNLRRLCIMDENDDDDYKHVIAQAQRIGTVIIAVVGPEGSTVIPKTHRSHGGNSSRAAEMLEVNALYHPTLERLFKLQPRLLYFKDNNLFFSFVDKLTPTQERQLLAHLKPPRQSNEQSCIIS
jgi:hypothetical protein